MLLDLSQDFLVDLSSLLSFLLRVVTLITPLRGVSTTSPVRGVIKLIRLVNLPWRWLRHQMVLYLALKDCTLARVKLRSTSLS
jgi:hypothetical protein